MVSQQLIKWTLALIGFCVLLGCSDADEKSGLKSNMESGREKWERIFRNSNPVSDISICSGVPIEIYLRDPSVKVCQPVIPWPDQDDKLSLSALEYQEQGPFTLEMISFRNETNIVFEVCSSYSLKNVGEDERFIAFDAAVEHFGQIYRACPDNPGDAEWITTHLGETCYCALRLNGEHENPRLVFSYFREWRPSEKTPEELCAKLDQVSPSLLVGDLRDWIQSDRVSFCQEQIRLGKCQFSGLVLRLDVKEPGCGFSVVFDRDSCKAAYARISLKFQGAYTKAEAFARYEQFTDFFAKRFIPVKSFDLPCDLTKIEAVSAWVRHSAEQDDLIILGLTHGLFGWTLECICSGGI